MSLVSVPAITVSTNPTRTELESSLKQVHDAVVFSAVARISQESLEIFKRLLTISLDEFHLTKDLVAMFSFSTENVEHVLKGAYVRLEDHGMMYKLWEATFEKKTDRSRSSSHASAGKQYSFQSPLFSEFLWGKLVINGTEYTWFQAERHPTGAAYLAPHLMDYVQYKMSGNNQGPWGESPFTEKNPLRIQKR